ncbi:hypothetical protein V6N13_048476 [Hibiscus sabdariffa]
MFSYGAWYGKALRVYSFGRHLIMHHCQACLNGSSSFKFPYSGFSGYHVFEKLGVVGHLLECLHQGQIDMHMFQDVRISLTNTHVSVSPVFVGMVGAA